MSKDSSARHYKKKQGKTSEKARERCQDLSEEVRWPRSAKFLESKNNN